MTKEEFNHECVLKLKEARFQDRIVVVGSGPSSAFIAPLSQLMERLENACAVQRTENEYFWNFCERAHEANPVCYYNVIRESYGTVPHLDARAYRHIVAINFKSYVTLNYDNQLPSVFRDRYPGDNFSVYPSKTGYTSQPADLCGGRRRLVAIHGYCDRNNPNWPQEVILKRSDYDLHYVSSNKQYALFNWWKNLLAMHPCVFIGTSLQEPGLHRVVEELLKDDNGTIAAHDHIHLKDFPRSNQPPYYSTPQKTMGAFRQIGFDPIDGRFSGLLQVLAAFSNLAVDDPSPGMVVPKPITAEDSFNF